MKVDYLLRYFGCSTGAGLLVASLFDEIGFNPWVGFLIGVVVGIYIVRMNTKENDRA